MAGTRTGVPFLDLGPVHRPLRDTVLAGLGAIVDAGCFVNGPEVDEFERAFAGYCGVEHCVGTASGLDALRLALLAAGIGPGDEVLVPAMTFVATVEAVRQAGATPVLVDVSPDDLCLDAALAAAAAGPATRALVPVHLYGHPADLAGLRGLAAERGLVLVEDAAQAHGAGRDGLRVGAAGLAGCFSFYPGKNLGAMGDAGAVTTSDAGLAATVRALREHGQTAKYDHEREGYTARLDTFQAAVLLAKLPHLDDWNRERAAIAGRYLDALAGVGDLVLPPVAPGAGPVWHLFVVRTADPAALASFLADRGVATGRHYPQPVHLTGAYRGLGEEGRFPVAEELARSALSLPLFPGISDDQVATVIDAVRAYFDDA